MNIQEIYENENALLKGHFKLSSGKHSEYYLQSAKVLEKPSVAKKLASALAKQIKESGIKIDTVCSPAIGGLIAGYALASELDVRYIFTERVNGEMTLRRGFEVNKGENILICEDIITTGGSAMEAGSELQKRGANIVAFAALANRGVCKRVNGSCERTDECKLPENLPFFALEDFTFKVYNPDECPMCKAGSEAIKPGSRGN